MSQSPHAPRPLSPETMAIVQGAFYVATGIWPVLHMPSFEAVTGPKTDKWLVRTVGSLIAVAGGVMLQAGRRNRVTPEIRALAVGSAAALTAVDCIYTARGRISPIYLLDAATELGLIAGWRMTGDTSRPALESSNAPADLPIEPAV